MKVFTNFCWILLLSVGKFKGIYFLEILTLTLIQQVINTITILRTDGDYYYEQ